MKNYTDFHCENHSDPVFYLPMKSLLVILLTGFSCFTVLSQEPSDESAIHTIIQQLFKGMYQGDSLMLQEVFHPDAQMASTGYTEMQTPEVRWGNVQQFIRRAGQPHEAVWDERIANLQVKVDDNLAQAWMDYSFYRGDTFSHCGVNTMTLVRTPQGWKILYLADSRRKEPCNP